MKPFLVGLLILTASSLAWTYLNYDLLGLEADSLFYTVNALWIEEPQPALFARPAFWGFLLLEILSTFGLTGYLTVRLTSPDSWAAMVAVSTLGTFTAAVRGVLAGFAGFYQGLALAILYITLAWCVCLGFAKIAQLAKTRDSSSSRREMS